jgi:hypothetical protein
MNTQNILQPLYRIIIMLGTNYRSGIATRESAECSKPPPELASKCLIFRHKLWDKKRMFETISLTKYAMNILLKHKRCHLCSKEAQNKTKATSERHGGLRVSSCFYALNHTHTRMLKIISRKTDRRSNLWMSSTLTQPAYVWGHVGCLSLPRI